MRGERSDRMERAGAARLQALVMMVALGAGGAAAALAAGLPRLPAHWGGLLDDYTAKTVKNGPYEMRGTWSLDLNQARGTAVFRAEIAMETADFANPDPTGDPAKLGAHTHHILVSDGVLDPDPMAWMTLCPASGNGIEGFVVTGTAWIAGNGMNVPFGNPSDVTICILGGTSTGIPGTAYVAYSNFTLTFEPGSHASSHFGSQAIHGVVERCGAPSGRESHACEVTVQE